MINYVELWVGNPTRSLDLSQEFQISLQYSIADVKDISKRNAAFSKTILLPGTQKNNTILGNLYDPNTDFTFFNPNVRTPCKLIVNSEVVMSGFLQLRNIKKLNNTDQSGNLIYWEVVIFNNTVELMTELGEKTMEDIDLGQLTHEYTAGNIIYSWTQSWTNGWVYPMYGFEQQPSTYQVTDFYPAYYSKFLLQSMLNQRGFGFTGSLFTNPQFEREIIPFVGSGSQSIGADAINLLNLRAGITQSYSIVGTFSNASTDITLSNGSVIRRSYLQLNNNGWQSAATPAVNEGDGLGFGNSKWLLPEDNFNDPLQPQNNLFDNGGDWNTTTSIWTTSKTRKWAPIWSMNYDWSIENLSNKNMWVWAPLHKNSNGVIVVNGQGYPVPQNQDKSFNYPWFDFVHTLEYETFTNLPIVGTVSVWNAWDSVTITRFMNTGGPGPTASGGNRTGQWTPGASFSVNVNLTRASNELVLPAGTRVRLKVKVQPSNNLPQSIFTYQLVGTGGATFSHYISTQGALNFLWPSGTGNSPNAPVFDTQNRVRASFTPRVTPQNFFFNNCLSFDAQEGDFILAKDFLGSKLKQKDFLTDLIKRYNLYIQPDPNNERLLVMDTRPDFYSRNLQLDWTQKKDLLSEDKWTILSELQFKEALFTMKEDSDFHNKDYKAQTGDIYGQYKWTFGNEFVKGVQKIESPYSPTPLVKTPFGAITPALSTDDPKVNTRVLFWGGLKGGVGNMLWQLSASQSSFTFSTYPYAGHFDDPINPTLDIHFGTPKYLYYNNFTQLPTKSMFTEYWSDWINQIEEGRMLTAKFYLDEVDIRTIRDNFWAKIWIFDSWYYVNKIIDYQPLQRGLTTVELLKIRDGVRVQNDIPTEKLPIRDPAKIKDPDPIGGVNVGINNGIEPGGGVVIGNSNQVGGVSVKNDGLLEVNRNLVVGDENLVKSNRALITGDRNEVEGSYINLLGTEGAKVSGSDIMVIGNREGREFTDGEKVYIGTGITADFTPKEGKIDNYSSGVNVNVEGYNLGQGDWRIVPEWKEVQLQPGKQSRQQEMTILGHYDIQGGGTYSIGTASYWLRALTAVETTIDIGGLVSLSGGELWVGAPVTTAQVGSTVSCGIGVFYATQSQAVSVANTPQKILLDTTNLSEGVSISNSRIVIDRPAAYRMSVTLLVESNSNQPEDVIFWLKFNGVDYPNSGHFVNVPQKKNSTTPSDTIITYEFIGRSIHPLDYVELYFQSSSINIQLKSRVVSGIPFSPAVIVNINKICD